MAMIYYMVPREMTRLMAESGMTRLMGRRVGNDRLYGGGDQDFLESGIGNDFVVWVVEEMIGLTAELMTITF